MKKNIVFFFLLSFCFSSYGQRTYKDTIDFEVASLKQIFKKSYSHIKLKYRNNYLSTKDSAIQKTLPDIIEIFNDSSQHKKTLNKYKIKIDSFKNNPTDVHFQIYKININDSTNKANLSCRCWNNHDTEYLYMVFYKKKRNKWTHTGIGWQVMTRKPYY
jgi:hypothetical protein